MRPQCLNTPRWAACWIGYGPMRTEKPAYWRLFWGAIILAAFLAVGVLFCPGLFVAPTLGEWPGESWRKDLDLSTQLAYVTTVRSAVLLTAGGTIAVATIMLTYARDARNLAANNASHKLATDADTTSRYTQAIGQLGAKSIAIRMGGIYALERIAKDSTRDTPTIVEVLAAFIRTRSLKTEPGAASPLEDVAAALSVIMRMERANTTLNLGGAQLPFAELSGANLVKANLRGARLDFAKLDGANLSHADLYQASLVAIDAETEPVILDHASLREAEFSEARMPGASMRSASLINTGLTAAFLDRADLSHVNIQGPGMSGAGGPWEAKEAIFTGATINRDLIGCWFAKANFVGTDFGGSKLHRIDIRGADLTEAKLDRVQWIDPTRPPNDTAPIWDGETKWPAGFPMPPKKTVF